MIGACLPIQTESHDGGMLRRELIADEPVAFAMARRLTLLGYVGEGVSDPLFEQLVRSLSILPRTICCLGIVTP